eukprot:COSAG01_NODE_13_length_41723_cov_145.394556_42_plen_64_part_00
MEWSNTISRMESSLTREEKIAKIKANKSTPVSDPIRGVLGSPRSPPHIYRYLRGGLQGIPTPR